MKTHGCQKYLVIQTRGLDFQMRQLIKAILSEFLQNTPFINLFLNEEKFQENLNNLVLYRSVPS